MPTQENTQDMIESFEFRSLTPGHSLVVFGRVHGNEPCGTLAIEKLIGELQSGGLALERGSVKLIPCCNPKAMREDKRYIDKNLNRVFCEHISPEAYEEKLANSLIGVFGRPTLLLDLHSFSSGDATAAPFALYKERNEIVDRLAGRIGIPYILAGWHELQEAHGRTVADSITHAAAVKASGLGLECGQHLAPNAPELAYRAIRIAMDELGLCSYSEEKASTSTKPKLLNFEKLFIYPEQGGQFIKPWPNFTPIKAGEPIAKLKDGTIISAPIKGYVVLTNPNARPGDEWFYIATETK